MKRSNSTSMLTDIISINKDRVPKRRNSISSGMKGRRILSTSNSSLPCSAADYGSSSPFWLSPVKHYHQQPSVSSPLSFSRINSPTSRVIQLRKEESVDERLREMEQDREVTSQLQLNQSWSELKLDDEDVRPELMETLPCPVSMTTGMHFSTPSSPVNISSRMRSRSLTPTSPSSSRTFTHLYRRSLSPAPLRPSSLVLQPQRKRQRNSDLMMDEMDISPTQLHPPAAKRAVFQSPLVPTSCTSPLLTASQVTNTSVDVIRNGAELHRPQGVEPMVCPAFDTSLYNNYTANHPTGISYDHTHQCMETSAFLPFKNSPNNGLTPPTSHYDGLEPHPPSMNTGGASSLNNCSVVVTTIS